MHVLITCYHVLDDKFKKEYELLNFSFFREKEKYEAIINLRDGRIFYQNKELDTTIIEIKNEDNLDTYSFLELDNSININNPILMGKEVYLLHYPLGNEEVHFSQGEIINICYDIKYFLANYKSEKGSSGCPILDKKTKLVIGMHQQYHHLNEKRRGIIIKNAIEDFKKVKKEEIKNRINSNYYSYIDTMDMIYHIPYNKPIKFFSDDFINRYKNKMECKIIHNGKEYVLDTSYNSLDISFSEKNKKEIKITLTGIGYITNMKDMFHDCKELKKVFATKTEMRKVESMESMFESCEKLEELSDTSHWNLENVKSLKGIFYNCINLKAIPGINKWNPRNLKDKISCYEMFLGCNSLNENQISQVMEWKNVDQNILTHYKDGFKIKGTLDFLKYCGTDKLEETCENILNFFNKLP